MEAYAFGLLTLLMPMLIYAIGFCDCDLFFFFSFVLLFWDCFYGFKQHVWEKVKVTKKLHLAEEGKAEAAKKRVGEFREYIIYVKEK